MEGRDPLLRRDKGKRKGGWGSVGLYLDKEKTRDQPLTAGLSLDWDGLLCSRTWGGREPAPGSVTSSEA